MKTRSRFSTSLIGVVIGRIFAHVSAEESGEPTPSEDSSGLKWNSFLVIGLVVISAFSIGMCVLGGCYFAIEDFRASHVARINLEKGMLEDEENVKDSKKEFSRSSSLRSTSNTADITHSSDSDDDDEEALCDDSLTQSRRSYTNDDCGADGKDEMAQQAGGMGAEELKEESARNTEVRAPVVPQVALDIRESAQQDSAFEAEERKDVGSYESLEGNGGEPLQMLQCDGGNDEMKHGMDVSPSTLRDAAPEESVNRNLFAEQEPMVKGRRKSRDRPTAASSEEGAIFSTAMSDSNTTPTKKASLNYNSASPLDERAIASTLLCNVCNSTSSSSCKCGQSQSNDNDKEDSSSVSSNNAASIRSASSGRRNSSSSSSASSGASSSNNGSSRSKTRRRSRPAPTGDKSTGSRNTEKSATLTSENRSDSNPGNGSAAGPSSEEEDAPASSSSSSASSSPSLRAVRPSSTARSRTRAAPRAARRLQEVRSEITDAQL